MGKLPAILLCLTITLCPTIAEAAEPILIRFSHVVSDDTPKGRGALLFKRLVAERLAGQVEVQVYPNSSLFGDADELEALRTNQVQMLAPSLAKFDGYTKQLQVFDLPFLFDDLDAVNRFQKRATGRQLLRAMEDHGIVGLAFWHNGMKQLSATRPLRTPQDANGLTFRIQPSAVLQAQFAAVGAHAVKLDFASTYKALQSGQVQGAENPWSNFYSQHFDQVQPYLTETNHGVIDYMLVSNPRFWYAIPHAIRTELEGIIEEVSHTVSREAEQLNREDRARILKAGTTQVLELTAEQREAWRQAMRPVWQQFEEQIGSNIIKAAETVNRRRPSTTH